MSGPPTSFHLVDRITELDPERGARGDLAIPGDLSSFPACLVVEAIGQLASWIAMRRSDFARRPVAARAGEVSVLASVRPGSRLDLEVVVRSCKSVAISYDGTAWMDGRVVVELRGAAGAMLPMDEFEPPEEARARFEALRGAGLGPRRFPDPVAFAPRVLERGTAGPDPAVRAVLEVPPPGPLYADHFPSRPVYPATLLLDAQLGLALELARGAPAAADAADDRLVGAVVRDVKVRSFTPPGGCVEVLLEALDRGGATEVSMACTASGQRVSSATLVVPPGVA